MEFALMDQSMRLPEADSIAAGHRRPEHSHL
jgi:hypothetical protein